MIYRSFSNLPDNQQGAIFIQQRGFNPLPVFEYRQKPCGKSCGVYPTCKDNIYNLGFGDLQADGKIDDKANSNNGDIVKVLSTIIHIIKDFTRENREIKIAFTGSTQQRTKLYQRILKTYLNTFTKEFIITALEGAADKPQETIFDPEYGGTYLAFFVKRKT